MMNKTELRAAAARLLYNDNRDTSDYNMLIDFIDNYFDNQQPTSDGWIPVSERLPDDERDVLVTDVADDVFVGWYDERYNEWLRTNCIVENIVAWQPLPQPFKENNDVF